MPAKLTYRSWISLLESKANTSDYLFDKIGPTNCDSNGNTLLHYAAYVGDHELCKVLISEGWFVLHKNVRGETALDYGVTHSSVREVLEAKVRSLPEQVLDFALSNHPQVVKEQARMNWRARANIGPATSLSDSGFINMSYEFSFTYNLIIGPPPAETSAHHGSFSPTGNTNDPDAADWILPEDLTSDPDQFASDKLPRDEFSDRRVTYTDTTARLVEVKSTDTELCFKAFEGRALRGRISAMSRTIRAFTCLLNSESISEEDNCNFQIILTEQDHEDYGDSLLVMKRVFDDELRTLRTNIIERWDQLRCTLDAELKDIASLLYEITATNVSVGMTSRNSLSREEQEDYGDSIDVMLRAFSEKLSPTDAAISQLKSELISDITSLNIELGALIDILDRLNSSSTSHRVSTVTDDDMEEYGESIEIMRRLCRAEISERVLILNRLIDISLDNGR